MTKQNDWLSSTHNFKSKVCVKEAVSSSEHLADSHKALHGPQLSLYTCNYTLLTTRGNLAPCQQESIPRGKTAVAVSQYSLSLIMGTLFVCLFIYSSWCL